MKKQLVLICLSGLLSACSNSDNSSEQYQKIVGYSQSTFTLRSVVIPYNDSTLNVTCYLDEKAKEACKGQFNNGQTATTEQIESIMSQLQIDSRIDKSLKEGCENKTLLLAVEPKLNIPEVNDSEFCFWTDENNTIISCDGKVVSQAEAEDINQRRLEKLKTDITKARKAGLDKFLEINSGIVNNETANSYLNVLYGALKIKLPACNWQPFIEKNKEILDIVEFRALVDDYVPKTCTEPVNYKILLNNFDNYNSSERHPKAFSQEITSKDGLESFKSLGLDDNIIDAIDFTKDMVLYLSAGEKTNTGYSLRIDCIDSESKIDAKIVTCAGQPTDDSMSEPIMLIQLPKGNYEVAFENRDIVCE